MPLDFIIVLVVAISNALPYTFKRMEIFDWNPELGYKTLDKTSRKSFIDRRKIKYPLVWKINNAVHMFLGVLIGWMILWLLYDKRLKPMLASGGSFKLDGTDLALFILGYVGINGRLPTIAGSVQEWFRRS